MKGSEVRVAILFRLFGNLACMGGWGWRDKPSDQSIGGWYEFRTLSIVEREEMWTLWLLRSRGGGGGVGDRRVGEDEWG